MHDVFLLPRRLVGTMLPYNAVGLRALLGLKVRDGEIHHPLCLKGNRPGL